MVQVGVSLFQAAQLDAATNPDGEIGQVISEYPCRMMRDVIRARRAYTEVGALMIGNPPQIPENFKDDRSGATCAEEWIYLHHKHAVETVDLCTGAPRMDGIICGAISTLAMWSLQTGHARAAYGYLAVLNELWPGWDSGIAKLGVQLEVTFANEVRLAPLEDTHRLAPVEAWTPTSRYEPAVFECNGDSPDVQTATVALADGTNAEVTADAYGHALALRLEECAKAWLASVRGMDEAAIAEVLRDPERCPCLCWMDGESDWAKLADMQSLGWLQKLVVFKGENRVGHCGQRRIFFRSPGDQIYFH